jgi:hypothetical protein
VALAELRRHHQGGAPAAAPRPAAGLKRTNCAFVTSAIESLDDAVLGKLDKGHTRADFLEAVALTRDAIGLPLAPTFIPFHPWTTMESYREFLRTLAALDFSTQIAPIQLAIRLLIPEGSLLLELPEIRADGGLFDARALYYPWHNADPGVDALCGRMQETIKREEKRRTPRAEIFRQIWDLAETGEFPDIPLASRATIPVSDGALVLLSGAYGRAVSSCKKQTWFHRKRGNAIVFSNKMPGENRTIENLTRQNSLFLSAAAQNAHEALLPIFTWLSGLLFVIGNRSAYRQHTAGLCTKLDYRNEIARLVSNADLGIAEMSVEDAEYPEKTKELLGAIVNILKLPKEAAAETHQVFRLLHRFGNTTMPFDVDQESDGTMAYLALLGPAVDAIKKGTPLLIDELDASLHPLLATHLIRLFNTPSSNPKGAQLIFNTHDTNLLSSGRSPERPDLVYGERQRRDEPSLPFERLQATPAGESPERVFAGQVRGNSLHQP